MSKLYIEKEYTIEDWAEDNGFSLEDQEEEEGITPFFIIDGENQHFVNEEEIFKDFVKKYKKRHIKFANFKVDKESFKGLEQLNENKIFLFLYNIKGKTLPKVLASMDNMKYLKLEDCKFKKIPNIFQKTRMLEGLEIQNMEKNIELPTSIGLLQNLRVFSLDNCVNEIDEVIFANHQLLKNLRIINNKNLKRIPQSVSSLKNLKKLNLSNNSLKEIPIKIKALKKLEQLNLSSNLLGKIPDEIIGLKNLLKLEIGENNIKKIKGQIFENLTELMYLDISNNQITKIPNTSMKKMKELRVFKANYNNLQEFPVFIFYLKKLKNCSLRYNNDMVNFHLSLEGVELITGNEDF